MKHLGTLFIIALAVFYLTGCVAYSTSPVTGILFTDVKAPVTATASDAAALKSGSASVNSVLGLIATGDASIETAAKSGGITKIHHVDYSSKSWLGIYAVYTVTVYGE